MIPNVVRGGDMGGLMRYLTGPGKKGPDGERRNEHEHPHVVAGDDFLRVIYGTEDLEAGQAKEISDYLEEPRLRHGTKVRAQATAQDPETGKKVVVGMKDAHVWHTSLSLRAEEGVLSDEKWQAIAADFMDRMGFTETTGKPPVRWVAIRHGLSRAGNDHVHIAASLVREDGTRWEGGWRDKKRAQEVSRELETTHGLMPVTGPEAGIYERGEQPGEQRRRETAGAVLTGPQDLEQRLRAAAVAARSEAEWVRLVRDDGVVIKPFYASATGEGTPMVAGYRAALKPPAPGAEKRPRWPGDMGGFRPSTANQPETPTPTQGATARAGERSKLMFYGGGKLARDLSLPRLRERWPEPDQAATAAAVAEWTAAQRGAAPVGKPTVTARGLGAPGRPGASEPDKLVDALAQWNERLVMSPHNDARAWSDAARDVAGAVSAWARFDPTNRDELTRVAASLKRSASVRRPGLPPGRVVQDPPVNAAALFLAARSKDRSSIAAAALLSQVQTTVRALAVHHQLTGDLREAERLRGDVIGRLKKVQTIGYRGGPTYVPGIDITASAAPIPAVNASEAPAQPGQQPGRPKGPERGDRGADRGH